jgi:hypothetical protein
MPASDLDDFIEAAVRALGIAIEAEWTPAIAANLATTLQHAATVEAFALSDEAEPAPIYRA